MLYAIVAVLVLVLDQAVKFWTVNNITPQAIGDACVELIPGVIHMTNVQNSGAAFSILAQQRWLLIVVSAVFIIAIIALISMDIIHTRFGRWTAVLVMAGALGNCIDRVLYGYVVDMFEFEMFTFAVFNVADIFITVCGILFCIHVIVYREPEEVRAAVPPKAGRRAPEPVYEEYDEYEDQDDYYEEEESAPKAQRKQGRVRAREREDPYANIPHRDRSEHRSLADELAPQDPDDPFAEWGGTDFDAPAPKRQPTPAPRQTRPAPKRQPAPADEWGDVDLDAPVKKSAPAPKPAAPAKPKAEPVDGGFEDFSLEDILSEFRD